MNISLDFYVKALFNSPMSVKKVKKKRKRKNSVAGKDSGGRPRREWTPKQITQMEQYAFEGCQTGTIAELMGVPKTTLEDNVGIRSKLTKKRAERKLDLRQHQNEAAKDKNPALLIFLGKNVLGQADKHDHELTGKDGGPIQTQIVDFEVISNNNDTK